MPSTGMVVAGPSIAALYPPRVGLPCAILPRPRERQAAGWLLHCPLQSSQQLVVHGRRRGVSLILSSHKSILTDYQPDTTHLTDNSHRLSRLGLGRPRRRGSGSQVGGLELHRRSALWCPFSASRASQRPCGDADATGLAGKLANAPNGGGCARTFSFPPRRMLSGDEMGK